MSRTILGSLVGALAVIALGAPLAHAAGSPAKVTVRVEGPSRTLVYAPLTTTRTPVVKDGDRAHACSGTSAAGALEQATGGAWDATYYRGLGYAVSTIDGVRPAAASDYWTLWVNGRSSSTGLCDTELQNGDELLLFVCRSGADDFACANAPLGLIAPRGKSARPTLKVVTYAADGSTRPAPGATVTGGASAVRADAAGNAKVTLRAGQSRLRATRDGDVPSAPLFCAADACGSRDRTPPVVSIAQIRDGQVFSAATAPRTLRGTALGLDGGIVELRLTRRYGGKCWAFAGRIDDFVRCPRTGAAWFQAADRERWSYLLPAKLPTGRYTLGALASDASGNVARRFVRFTVAAPAAASPAVSPPAVRSSAARAAAVRVPLRIVAASGRRIFRRTVGAAATTVKVGSARCAVASGTPLAALLAARRTVGLTVKVADYGSCGASAADGGGLYVTQVAGDRGRGQAGWVYSVGGRLGTAGAADPSGPFGSGRLKRGQQVVWFWCREANRCEEGTR